MNYDEFEIPDNISLVNNDDDVLEPVIVSPSLMDPEQLPPNLSPAPCLDASGKFFFLVFDSVCVCVATADGQNFC